MIYSNYNTSTTESVNYLDDFKIGFSGINIPNTTNIKEQSMFLEGVAETKMISLFEKIGMNEQNMFTESTNIVHESFDDIKDFFKNILDNIAQFFQKIIQWITDKVNEAKKYFREKDVEKKLTQIAKVKGTNQDSKKVVAKVASKVLRPNDNMVQVATFRATRATVFAKQAFDGEYAEQDVSAFKLEIAKSFVKNIAAMGGEASTLEGVFTGYKNNYIDSKNKKEVTFAEGMAMLNDLKNIVLGGSQKAVVKKVYQQEKKGINDTLNAFKKASDKKDEGAQAVIARVKDIILVMDRFCKVDMQVVQQHYVDAYAIINGLAKIGRATKEVKESFDFSEFDY